MTPREIFRAVSLPVLQNRVFATAAEAFAGPTGNIVLVQAMDTGLIFNSAFDPDRLEYDQNYQNEQAYSGVFQNHLDAVTAVIRRHFHGRTLLEVGCGKGYFLDHLQGQGYDITGIDPAYEGSNPRVLKAPFERGLGLSADAVIYIEVPCFDWICRHRAWFDIFYEHVNYFRMTDFHRMFGTVLESGHVFGGQYLYVVADLSSLRRPRFDQTCALAFPADFLDGIHRLSLIACNGERNAIWGAASKGVVFAVYMQRAGVQFEFAIDISPVKQGKFLAGSGLRVTTPTEAAQLLQPGDNIFVMNSNYLDEIIAQSGNRYHYCKADHG